MRNDLTFMNMRYFVIPGAKLLAGTLLLAASLTLGGCGLYQINEVEVIGPEEDTSRLSQEPYVPVYAENSPEEEARARREEAVANAEEARQRAAEEAEAAKDPTRRTLTDTLNLREEPDGTVLIIIPAGEHVYLTGKEKDGWYPVRYEDYEGYVAAGYFEESEEDFEEIEEEEEEVKEGRIFDDEDSSAGPGHGTSAAEESAAEPGQTPVETPVQAPSSVEIPADASAVETPAETPAAQEEESAQEDPSGVPEMLPEQVEEPVTQVPEEVLQDGE